MSTEYVEDLPKDESPLWLPEARALEEIRFAEQAGEKFRENRARWLGRLLGVKSYDRGPVTETQFEAMNQAHTLAIIDALPDLREAAQIKGKYDTRQKLRIGLWLVGWEDSKIGEVFDETKSAVLVERKTLVDRIAGGRNHPQPIDTREAVDTARVRVAMAVLGSVAVSHYVKPADLPNALKPTPSSSGLEKLKTYPAAELIKDIETRFMERGILSPEGEWLLARHFLDTEDEMTGRERDAISRALKNLRDIRRQEELRAQLNHDRPIYKSMQFLRILVGDDRNKPISRATYVKKYMPGLERLASKSLEEEIAEDDHKLDMVFSWLLTRKSRPPEPSGSKKARTKPFAGAKAFEAS